MCETRFPASQIDNSAWIAAGAIVVGDVSLAANVSVWFTAVLRGDSESLSIGENTNIQDGVICHADPGFPLVIGAGVTVGHRAIVHGAQIGDHSLIGMGAIILNGARIGSHCIVGAGALVTQGKVFPDHSLIIGSPAKAIRAVSADEMAMIRRSAADYVIKARAFRDRPGDARRRPTKN